MLSAAECDGRSHHQVAAPASTRNSEQIANIAARERWALGRGEPTAGVGDGPLPASGIAEMRWTNASIDLSQPVKASIHWRVESSYAKASLGSTSSILSAITGTWYRLASDSSFFISSLLLAASEKTSTIARLTR